MESLNASLFVSLKMMEGPVYHMRQLGLHTQKSGKPLHGSNLVRLFQM